MTMSYNKLNNYYKKEVNDIVELLNLFNGVMNEIRDECYTLARRNDIYLQEDSCNNIWLECDTGHCERVRGWNLVYVKLNEVINNKVNS